jgi:hypothetical protein
MGENEMVNRTLLGVFGIAAILSSFWAARADAADFKRPDCSAFENKPLPEASCFRKAKLAVRDANYEALQQAGLEFVYLARPPAGKELDAYPDAKKAAESRVEGEFLLTFSVNADGNVHDVRIIEASSAPIGHLAKLWADTIAQWRFVRLAKPVTGVPFRRIYLYSQEEDERDKKSGG